MLQRLKLKVQHCYFSIGSNQSAKPLPVLFSTIKCVLRYVLQRCYTAPSAFSFLLCFLLFREEDVLCEAAARSEDAVVSVAFFLHVLCIEMLVGVITVAFLFLILA